MVRGAKQNQLDFMQQTMICLYKRLRSFCITYSLVYVDTKQLMATTLKDIANKMGVSVSTVSRVLNDQPGISAKTREQVLPRIAGESCRLPNRDR